MKRKEQNGDIAIMLPPEGKFARFWFRLKHSEYLYLLAAFFLPFTILLGVYACLGTHPFGNSSVLTLDLQAQYIYYYEEIRRLLTQGGSWLYSWKRTLGGEFMGIVAYYGASPLNIIFALFPKDRIADAMMTIQLFKVGFMGLTFGYYIHKTRFVSQMHTIAFSLMYALCAYSVVQLANPMWLDAMIFLPLLILGLEALINERKFILYTASLTMIFITNYYIGYMCGIFTFFYFLYYYSLKRDDLMYKGEEKISLFKTYGFRTFMRFAFFTLISLLIAAFMLIAAYYSLTFGKSGFSNPSYSFSLRFDFLDLIVKLLPGSYDSVRPTGLPMIYSGLLALIAIPLYYMSPAITKKQKVCASMLLAVLLFSFSINVIDLVWHGFSAPNWLNYRYSFVFAFFIIVMAYDAVAHIEKIKFGQVGAVCAILAVLVMIIQKLDYVFDQDTKQNPLDDATCIFLTLVLIAAYVIVLNLLSNRSYESSAAFILAIVVCVEMFANTLITIAEEQTDVGAVKYDNYLENNGTKENYSSYRGAILRSQDLVNKVLDSDKSFYRMEMVRPLYRNAVNMPMAFGFNGIAHSTSTLNSSVIKFMNSLGYTSQSHYTYYVGGTPLSDALLGIKYVITENDTLDPKIYTVAESGMKYYKYIKSDDVIYAMQNTKALPIAYGVSPSMLTADLGDISGTITGLEFQNNMILEMLSGTGFRSNVFKGISATIDYENCNMGISYTHPTKYIDKDGNQQVHDTPYYTFDKATDGAKVTFTLTAPQDGDIYVHFPADNFQKTCDLYVNGKFISEYFKDTSGILNIGSFKKGTKIVAELRLKKDATYFSRESDYYFYCVDYNAMTEAINALDNCGMYVEEHGNSHLKGEITVTDGQTLVFTTIPYDAGWNVYVDGKKVETHRTLSALLSFEVEEGFHTLEFRYMPKCYVVGFIASGVGIVLFAFFIIITKVKKVRSKVFAKAKFLGEFINDGTPAVIEGEAHEVAEETPESGDADAAYESFTIKFENGADAERTESTDAETGNDAEIPADTKTENESEPKPDDTPDAE